MALSDYTGRAVLTAVDLVNSLDVISGADALGEDGDLGDLLVRRGWVVDRPLTPDDVRTLKALRPRLRFAFDNPAVGKSVDHLNEMLREFQALPQLTDHDGTWHWHHAHPGAALARRVATTCVVALLTVIADDGAARLRGCEAAGCGNVFVDASRPGSRRYCDTRSCGNKTHVHAYRARRRQADSPSNVSS